MCLYVWVWSSEYQYILLSLNSIQSLKFENSFLLKDGCWGCLKIELREKGHRDEQGDI
jgi:hypothetical protein